MGEPLGFNPRARDEREKNSTQNYDQSDSFNPRARDERERH